MNTDDAFYDDSQICKIYSALNLLLFKFKGELHAINWTMNSSDNFFLVRWG